MTRRTNDTRVQAMDASTRTSRAALRCYQARWCGPCRVATRRWPLRPESKP